MRDVFAEQSFLEIIPSELPDGMSCLDSLATGEADLCREENSVAFVTGVRAVLPIHQSVLHVFMRDGFEPDDPLRPLEGASVLAVGGARASLDILEYLAQRQGLSSEDYTLLTSREEGSPDLVLYLGPIHPGSATTVHPGYTMMSLDERLGPEIKVTQEGLKYALPNMVPVIIPALTYDIPGNDGAVSTLGVDTLLLTRKDMPVPVVYELAKTLLQQKPRFNAISPAFFAGVNEDFDPLSLNFPLHAGARRYLHRDEPGLLERYAETINMLMYLAVLLLSGFVAFARWRARRKKDRVDVFYLKVLEIRERSGSEAPEPLLAELLDLETEAFDSLVREKLAADESFRIFTDLLQRVRAEIRGNP
jgi:hypothetical protein